MKNKFFFILTCWLIGSLSYSSAQDFKFRPDRKSQRKTGTDIRLTSAWDYVVPAVKDDKFDDLVTLGGTTSAYKFKSIQDIVRIGIDHDAAAIESAYEYQVNVQIRPLNKSTGGYMSSGYYISKTLVLQYDPATRQVYQDQSIFKFSDYLAFDVRITGVQKKIISGGIPSWTPVAPAAIARNFFIEAEVISQRYDRSIVYVHNSVLSADSRNLTVMGILSSSVSTPGGGFGSIRPGYDYKPVFYELEWTYIDDYNHNTASGSTSYGFTGSLYSVSYDFRKNATRVQMDYPVYTIPLTYEHGAIVHRWRMVRPNENNYTELEYGPWSLPDNSSLGSSISGFSNYVHLITTAHSSDSLNWQYTVNFAEEGKFKHVINYFDGALKDRQTQTKINSNPDKVIVVDKAYDYEGRPSLVSLPVPVTQNGLFYNKGVMINSSTSQAYKAADFDILPGCSQPGSFPVLSTTSAARIYYSPLNPDKSGMQQFVPDAGGYPLVQTVYSPDNTNKVSWQGGAGLPQQLWQGHGTRYEYVRAMQPELDKLLGTEAGAYQFYPKQIISDPNGQSSFSILNPQGKVVISGLQGAAPNSADKPIDALDNFVPGELVCSELLKNENQEKLQNGLRYFTTLYNDNGAGGNTLEYRINTFPFNTGCDNQYLWTKGYYSVRVLDDCGTEYSGLGINGIVGSETASSGTGAGSSRAITSPVKTANLPKGKFLVEKNLTFSETDIYNQVKAFVKSKEPSCYYPEEHFVREAVERSKFPCEATEEETAEEEGTVCGALKQQMIRELYPKAKYGTFEASADGRFLDEKENSIFTVIEYWQPGTSATKYTIGITEQCAVKCSHTTAVPCGDEDHGCGCTMMHYFPDRCCEECVKKKCKCMYFPALVSTTITPYETTAYENCKPKKEKWHMIVWDGFTPGMPPGTYEFDPAHRSGSGLDPNGDPSYYYWGARVYECSCGQGEDTVWRKFYHHYPPKSSVLGEYLQGHDWVYATVNYDNDGFVTVENPVITYGRHNCQHTKVNYTTDSTVSVGVDILYRYQLPCISYPTIKHNGKTYTNADIKQMEPDLFMQIFNEQIAEALLPLHPEYCRLLGCNDDLYAFEQEFEGLKTFQEAMAKGFFSLNDITDKDPLAEMIVSVAGGGSLAHAKNTLKYPYKYDRLLGISSTSGLTSHEQTAIRRVYCGAGNSEEESICAASSPYSGYISGMTFISDEIKQRYFESLQSLYMGSRGLYKQQIIDRLNATHCNPCGDYRMTLIPEAVFAGFREYTINSTGDLVHEEIGDALKGLYLNGDPERAEIYDDALYDGFDLTTFNSKLNGSYAEEKEQLIAAEVNSVITALANCHLSPSQLDNIRTTLTANLNAGQQISPDMIRSVLQSAYGSSAVFDDLCHPFLVRYGLMPNIGQAQQLTAQYSCGSGNLYTGMRDFLTRSAVRNTIRNATATAGGAPGTNFSITIGGISPANAFEEKLMAQLGYTATSTPTTYTINVKGSPYAIPGSCGTSCKYIRLTFGAVSPGGWGEMFMYIQAQNQTIGNDLQQYLLDIEGPTIPSPNPVNFDAITCINDEAKAAKHGLIAQKTAVLSTSCAYCFAPQKYYVWTNTIDLMTPVAGVADMNDAITCLDIKNAISDFQGTDKSTYGYGDAAIAANHPLYQRTLCNYLNFKFNKQYQYEDYQNLMEGCALSDQAEIPRSIANLRVEVSNASADAFEAQLRMYSKFQPNILRYKTGTVAGGTSGNTLFLIDLNPVDFKDQRFYRYYLAGSFPSWYSFAPVPLSGVISYQFNYKPSAGDHVIFSPAACSYSLPGGTTSTNTNVVVWLNGSTYDYKMRSFRLSAGSPTNKNKSDLIAQVKETLHGSSAPAECTAGFEYWNSELLRTADYGSNTLRQQYLTRIYSLSASPRSSFLANIAPGSLAPYLSSYSSGYTFTYDNPYMGGAQNHLHAYQPNPSATGYNLLKNNILAPVFSNYSSKLFPDLLYANVPASPSGAGLAIARKTNGVYWYRYFGADHKMYNVYLNPPENMYGRAAKDFTASTANIQMGPSPRTFFVTLSAPASGSFPAVSVKCTGYTDFDLATTSVVAHNIILHEVSETVKPVDSNDCEKYVLNEAVQNGKAAYYDYFNATVSGLSKDMMTHLINTSKDSLIYCGRQQQYQATLYYYDLGGNLTRTVPPMGVQALSGLPLSSVEAHRSGLPYSPPETEGYYVGGVYYPPYIPNYKITDHKKVSTYHYNSLNQLVFQKTPDGGITYFFYDAAGRQIFSQNSKQRPKGLYSYSLYDPQGRPMESGEVKLGCVYPESSTADFDTTYCLFNAREGGTKMAAHPDFVTYSYDENSYTYQDIVAMVRQKARSQVVLSYYDMMITDLGTISSEMLSTQENLRSRVASINYYENLPPTTGAGAPPYSITAPAFATHYSYDLSGNVKTITYESKLATAYDQRYKRVDYDYDLISGKVNMVSYNRGHPDQFYQQYDYDADNRITQVNTSNDGLIWNKDAEYSYYQHGPLARVKLGNQKIQSLEYAYTIQGWLKAINGDVLNPDYDMGKNGLSGDITYPRDVIAHALRYFQNDYQQIGTNAVTQLTASTSKNLYNGNISQQTTGIQGLGTLQRVYQYDQLQRLKWTTNYNVDDNTRTVSSSPANLYKSTYTYDPDGNIKTLDRWEGGTTPQKIDDFDYSYDALAANNNKLLRVQDAAAATTGTDLQPGQSGENYKYDKTGNLIFDEQASEEMDWDRFGKVRSIRDIVSNRYIRFAYDGKGNRIWKDVINPITGGKDEHEAEYYVRDAGGNILSVYRMHSKYNRPLSFGTLVDIGVSLAPGTLTGILTDLTDRSYPSALISVINASHSSWVSSYTARPISFFLDADPTLKSNLIYSGENWINAMRAYDPSIYTRTIQDAAFDVEPLYNSAMDFPTEGRKLLELYSMFMPNAPSVWSGAQVNYIPGNHVTNANALYSNISANPPKRTAVINTMITGAMNNPPSAETFYTNMVNNATLWNSTNLRSNNGPWTLTLRDIVNNYTAHSDFADFFDNWPNGESALAACTSPDYKLNAIYESAPETTLHDMTEEATSSEIKSILSGMPDLTAVEFGSWLIGKGADATAVEDGVRMGSSGDTISLAEHHIYGSSRLGVQRYDSTHLANFINLPPEEATNVKRTLKNRVPWYSFSFADMIDSTKKLPYDGTTVNTYNKDWETNRTLGRRYYEMTDHLGNVLATVLDRKTGEGTKAGSGGTLYDRWIADIASATDYYPGGMMMPGRTTEYSWSRMGYNGQAKDDEVYGKGNLNSALFWQMDTRIIRRWNLDPVDQISISNYAVNQNNFTVVNDPLGDDPEKGDENDPIELKPVTVQAQSTQSTGMAFSKQVATNFYGAYIANKSFGDDRPRTGDPMVYASYNLARDQKNQTSASLINAGVGKNYPWGVRENVTRIFYYIFQHPGNTYNNGDGTKWQNYGEVYTSEYGQNNGQNDKARVTADGGSIDDIAGFNSGGGSGAVPRYGDIGSSIEAFGNVYHDIKSYWNGDKPIITNRPQNIIYHPDGGMSIDIRPNTDTNGISEVIRQHEDSFFNRQ